MSARDLQVIADDVYGLRDSFESVLVDPAINFEREAGFAMQILQASDYMVTLAKTPEGKASLLAAVNNIAAIGISLNPATKQAYLVPRKKKICLDISYMGLMDLAVRAGAISWAQAVLVHEKDEFQVAGFDRPPVHRFAPFSKDRGPVIGVYCVAKLPSGDYLTDMMSLEEIVTIRDRSESWKKDQGGPWKTDFGEMARKTVVKRSSKYWPDSSGRIDRATHYLNTEAGEGLAELAGQRQAPAAATAAPAAPAPESRLLQDAEEAASKGVEALRQWWETKTTEPQRESLRGNFRGLRKKADAADAARTIDQNEQPAREPGQDDEEQGQ